MDAQNYNAPPLSARENALLSGFARERRTRITIDDVRSRVGPAARAGDVVWRLVRKGALLRVSRGVYLVVPYRSLNRQALPSAAVAVAALLHDSPYYLGGLWAFSHHRLTTQQYFSALDAFVRSQRRPRVVHRVRVRFHPADSRWLETGVSIATLEGSAVKVSDAEKTMLDALARPRVVGGMTVALRLINEALPRIDHRRLIQYAVELANPSTCQRLGLVLQRSGAGARQLAPLRRRIQESRSDLSLIPGRARTGPIDPTWRVVENDT